MDTQPKVVVNITKKISTKIDRYGNVISETITDMSIPKKEKQEKQPDKPKE